MYLRSADGSPLVDATGRPVEVVAAVEPLLTPPEIAEQCRVSVRTVLRAIHAGRLTASRLGTRGTYRVRSADVEAWLAGTVVEPPQREAATVRHEPIELPALRPTEAGSGRLQVTERMGRR